MKRRNFLKALGATAASVSAVGTLATPTKVFARGKEDIGECKSLKVTVLSETSWFNNDQFKADITNYGGASTNQYDIPWDPKNAGGYSTLLEIEQLDGTVNKLLLDTGWNNEWMDYVFNRHGIDKMLASGEIDTMVQSHWHLDHFWGIESTLKHNDKITMYGPETMYPEDEKLLYGGKLEAKGVLLAKNDVPFKGKLVKTNSKDFYKLYPGVAVKNFDVPILLRVRGESVIYVNVKDKGIVTVTGCCHPGLLTLYSTARRQIEGGDKIYGCYGGLHISLFENWDPKFDDIIKGAKAFNPTKMGCNHCTGWIWAENAAKAGLPIVKGTDTYKTYPRQSAVAKDSNVFLTNGDTVVF
jgi:7,8-dihydropterin-6-yl-methyl-4-(beta-D-ribofuranosyl)aminobenzene 5'-phosphate synthase